MTDKNFWEEFAKVLRESSEKLRQTSKMLERKYPDIYEDKQTSNCCQADLNSSINVDTFSKKMYELILKYDLFMDISNSIIASTTAQEFLNDCKKLYKKQVKELVKGRKIKA